MAAAIERCGITHDPHVAHASSRRRTSRRSTGMVFLEDVLQAISAAREGCACSSTACLLPACAARAALRRDGRRRRRSRRSIFSSGSTGVPKGVMLTHRNILANVDADRRRSSTLRRDDVMVGVLPFFHSFGFTGDAVAAAGRRLRRRLPPQPDGRARPSASWPSKYRGTILDQHADVLRRLHPQVRAASSSRTLRYAIVGAEKLREPIAAAFKEKFGITLLEGYGCTEMAPVVAVNAPDVDDGGEHQRGSRPARSATRCPGVVAKIVDPETGEGPLIGREGLLLVNGPNRMLGYLGDAGAHAPRCCATAGTSPATSPASTRRLHPHHRSAVALQQDRRRDGAAHARSRSRSRRCSTPQHSCAVTAVPDESQRRAAGRASTPTRRRAATSCGSGSAAPSCRGCGCPSARTCASSTRSRRSAPARSTCARCGASPPARRRGSGGVTMEPVILIGLLLLAVPLVPIVLSIRTFIRVGRTRAVDSRTRGACR